MSAKFHFFSQSGLIEEIISDCVDVFFGGRCRDATFLVSIVFAVIIGTGCVVIIGLICKRIKYQLDEVDKLEKRLLI